MKRSSPPKRRKPLSRGKANLKRSTPRRARARTRQRAFSELYPPDHPGPRYGPLFRTVRAMPCWLCVEGYDGPGHEVGWCNLGVQGGPTAHHVGRNDEDGLIPGGGKAHDLYAGYAGRRAQEHFSGWLERKGHTLEAVGLEFVRIPPSPRGNR